MAKISSIFVSGLFSKTITTAKIETSIESVSKSIFADQKTIDLEEISWHDRINDCWIVIYDRVYDITEFLDEHPGGADILLEYAGRDATVAFRGSGHSSQAIRALDRFCIGELPMTERIFRKPGGFRLSNLPD